MPRYSRYGMRRITRHTFKPVAATTLYTKDGPAAGTIWIARDNPERQSMTVHRIAAVRERRPGRAYIPYVHFTNAAKFPPRRVESFALDVEQGRLILIGMDVSHLLPTCATIP